MKSRLSFQLLFLLIVGFLLASLPALATSQVDSMIEAINLNKQASDQSLQNSTTSAMKALMDLGEHNRTGAMSNGYKSYGQYRNSEDLDTLRLKNAISTLKLDSAGQSTLARKTPPIQVAPISDFETSYQRINPAFLRQGDAGKVADEFERKTGMGREIFLKQLSLASDNQIYPDDPRLMDKVLSRFEGFVKEIPNAKFRANVENEIKGVPQTFRTGLVAKAVGKFAALFSGASVGGDAPSFAAKAKSVKLETPSSSVAINQGGTPVRPISNGAPEDSALPRNTASLHARDSGYRGVDKENWGTDGMGGVIQTALNEQREETIFKQISRRYRALTERIREVK